MRSRFSRLLLVAGLFACSMLGPQAAASAEEVSIRITRPQPDETLHDNTGAVPVAVTLHGLGLAATTSLRVLFNGNPHGADRRVLEFTLENVARGTHALRVQLIGVRDTVIAESPTVTFHLWQASRLLPPRNSSPP